MSNCSDVGFERHSPRDARLLQFVTDGPGIAGFQFTVDPEEDGDAAAQFLAHADMARVEEGDFRVSARHSRELSLEAIEGLGVEFADPDSDEESDDDGYPDEDDERPRAIVGLDPKYLVERPEGVIDLFRDGEFQEITPRRERPGNGRLYWEMVIQPRIEAMRLVSRVLTAAKPEPAKGNGHKPAAPPVGKFLKGTVVGSGPLGLLVETEGGIEVRIAVDDEFGHGSKTAARQWLHSHAMGRKVRVRVKYVNGAIYGVLTYDKHPRPWWRKKEEVSQQVEAAPAAN